MSNSFYGGRDGAPMVIKKKYETIVEMLKDFNNKDNVNHPDLKFGDHVIIQSKNRNNPENGRIFRRSLDIGSGREIEYWRLDPKTNIFVKDNIDAQGAVLVGQIVGPSGNAPHLHLLSTKADVDAQYTDFNNKPGYDIKVSEKDSEASVSLGSLVAGKEYLFNEETGEPILDEDNNHRFQFNDKITWRYCSVRDESQQETDAYIGFEIPYTVIEFEATSVEPYYNRTDRDEIDANKRVNFGHDPLVEGRTDEGNHPFYEKWKINIPRGVRGMSIENIGIAATAEKIEQVYAFDFTDKEAEDSRDANTGLLKVKSYDGKDDDKANNRQIMYCTVVDYDRIAAGDKYKIYLGDYNMIIKDQVKFEDDGSLSIDYTHEDKDEWPQKVNWITGISLDKDSGEFILTTNNDNINNIDEKLTWIKNAKITEDGRFQTESTTGDNVVDQPLQWVKEIKFAPDGTITIVDINGDERTGPLNDEEYKDAYKNLIQWITNISLESDTGAFKIDYNNGAESLETTLQWVKDIDINPETGAVTVSFTGDKEDEPKPYKLQWPTNIKVNDDGTITTEYNNGESQTQGPKINWVASADLTTDNKLSIIYAHNENVKNVNELNLKTVNDIKFNNGSIYADYNDGTSNQYIGSIDNATVNMITGDENMDTSNLRTGGLWFVTKEMEV